MNVELLKWEGPHSKEWENKCTVCWSAYLNNIQHENSLKCWKLGIPFSCFNDVGKAIEIVKDLVKEYNNSTFKYTKDFGILNIITKGIIIVYFESKEDMIDFIKKFKEKTKEIIKSPTILDNLFYKYLVNTENIEKYFFYRRGCPEYDFKFGNWRNWPSYNK